MPYSKQQVLQTILVASIAIFASGCFQKSGKTSPNTLGGKASASIRISLAGARARTSSSLSSFFFASSASGGSTFVPASLSDFDCFAVNVIAPDIQALPVCGGDTRMGVAAGFIHKNSGNALELQVPFGSSRTFQVWGFARSSGCPDVTSLIGLPRGTLPGGAESPGFLLAERTVDVTDRHMTLDLDAGFTFGTTPRICGSLPEPRTSFDYAETLVGAVAITDGEHTSDNGDVCIGYSSTAVSPAFKCTLTVVDGATTTSTVVPCASGGCPANPGGFAFRASSVTAANQTKTMKLTVESSDSAYGTVESSPPTFTWTVDTLAPTVSIVSINPGKINGLGTVYHTKSTRPLVTLSASEAVTVTTEVDSSGTEVTCNSVTAAGNFACLVSPAFVGGAGAHTVDFRATDAAGNVTAIPTTTFELDFTSPTVAVQPTDGSTNLGWVMGGRLTDAAVANASGFYNAVIPLITDAGGADASALSCTMDTGTTYAQTVACVSGSSLDFTTSDRGGKHGLTITTTDLAGNAASAYSLSVYIDSLLGLFSVGRATSSDLAPLVDESASTSIVANLPGATGFLSVGQSALDADGGVLYVADPAANRVLGFAWDSFTHALRSRKALFVLGQPNFELLEAGQGITTVDGVTYDQMSAPWGVAVGVSGSSRKLFVADSGNNRVLRFDLSSSSTINGIQYYSPTITADAVFGQLNNNAGSNLANITGNNSSMGAANTSQGLYAPKGLHFYNDYLFVAEELNCRVAIFSAAASTAAASFPLTISQQIGTGQTAIGGNWACISPNPGQDHFAHPHAVVVDGDNDAIYVADTENNRALVYDLSAVLSTTPNPVAIDVIGQPDFMTVAGDAGTTEIPNLPYGIEVVQNGFGTGPYVAITQPNFSSIESVKFYDATTLAYSMVWNPSGGTTTGRTTFDRPQALHYDPASYTLFVSDNDHYRVAIYQTSDLTTISSNQRATDVLGHTDSSGTQKSFRAAAQGGPNDLSLSAPTYVVADSIYKRLYVSDTANNRVLVYDLDPTNLTPTATSASAVLGVPSQNDGVAMLDSAPSGTYGISNKTLNAPKGLALDSRGRLFVVDSGNNRVLRFATNSSVISSSMSADLVLGQNGSFATNATTDLSSPSGVAFDPTGDRLYVTDSGHDQIVVWGPMTNIDQSQAYVVFGGNGVDEAHFDNPTGIAYTAGFSPVNRGVFVADTNNNRVMFFDLSTTTTGQPQDSMTGVAFACFGSRGATTAAMCANVATNDGGTLAGNGLYGLSGPTAAYFSESSPPRLYVADTGNHRVAVYDMSQTYNQPAQLDDPDLATNRIFHAMGALDLISSFNASTATPASLKSPVGIFRLEPSSSSASRLLYISDQAYHRVGAYEVP